MADYRAKNRNTKAVDVARVRAAANYKVPTMPDLQDALKKRKEELAREAGITTNEMGVWYDPDLSPTAQRIATAESYLPTSAARDFFRGVKGFATLDYNPEGIKYPTRMVPAGARGGGMVSGGGPGIGSSFSALPGAIYRAIKSRERTDEEKRLFKEAGGNPRVYAYLLNNLDPARKAQNYFDAQINSNQKDYNNLISMLSDVGISEEEMYRDVVVGPDGQVNLNANTQAALEGIGYAADSLRGTELIGYGLGKPVGLAARAATKAAGTGVKAATIPFRSGAKIIPRVVDDIAVRGFPIPVPSTIGGGMPVMRVGGSANKAAREAAALRATEAELSLAPEDRLPIGALEELQGNRSPIMPGSPEARIVDEAKNATPKNIDTLLPTKRNANGDYDAVEINAQDEASGLTTFDPSELRLLTLGGTGAYGKFGPLAKLSDLTIHKTATKIRAIYTPPPAKEILRLMNRTDQAVATRPNVKPGTWVKNTYTIEDAQVLLDRWKTAASEFEKANGRPLPWRLEADVPNPKKGGEIEVKRIFGQDVEHAIPVNQGGKGTVDELVLLPSIGNSGKRDFAWADYASNNPYNWNAYLESFYGDIKKF